MPPHYVPPPAPPRPAELYPTDREFAGLRLFPFQVKAVDAIAADHTVLVAAPTGSGKTLVADYAIDQAFATGHRVIYTSPIKALSNQKFRDFRARHGDAVGIMTGDVTMNGDAPLLVMTTEVFRNTLFDEPERMKAFRFVVHDEVHYLDDKERGTVWEESIIHAPPTMRLVCLSATVPNVRELTDWIASVRGEDVTVVEMVHRPVPLDHLVWVPDHGPVSINDACKLLDRPEGDRKRMRRERSPARLLDWIEAEKLTPVLYFCFSRKECEALALENRRRTLLSPHERDRMRETLADLLGRYAIEDSPTVQRLVELALAGVAYHHAGMLPIHKEIVERLFTSGLVRMLFATETFALGVNMPARTVAFSSLRKFDGERMDYMLCREYGQMAGRAGRQGIDTHGLVISRIDPSFDKSRGVRRVLTGANESVNSRFNPDYSTILNLYTHMGDRVVETYEKSFAKFQRGRRRALSGESLGGRSDEERILTTRLAILKQNGYIEDGKLTERGEFAARISGYEIHAAEWRAAGLFERLEPRALGALLMSASYEPRIDEMTTPPRDRDMRQIARDAFDILERWRRSEHKAGLTNLQKEPHFGLSGVLEAWMGGVPLPKCKELTSASEGDIVRWLRQMLQYARQIQRASEPRESALRRRIADLILLVNRDEVDAKRQLELGQDPLDGEDAEDRPTGVAPVHIPAEPAAPAEPEPQAPDRPSRDDRPLRDDRTPPRPARSATPPAAPGHRPHHEDRPREKRTPPKAPPAAPADDFGAGID